MRYRRHRGPLQTVFIITGTTLQTLAGCRQFGTRTNGIAVPFHQRLTRQVVAAGEIREPFVPVEHVPTL